MRILLLMQWFDPEPQIKGLVFAKKLRDLGNTVEVLTGFPNYPGGSIYPGYSIKLFQVETMEGIRVVRVPLYPSHDRSAIRRALNYLSFGAASCIGGLLTVSRKTVIYACGPPITVGVSAALVSCVKRVPFVYDIQDVWPDSLAATGMFNSALGSKIIANICSWVYKRAAHIVVQSPGVRDLLLARGVDQKKVSVILNWCDESSISHQKSKPLPHQRDPIVESRSTFDVLFAGNIGKAQDMDAVLDAGRILQVKDPSVRLLLLGGGVEVSRLKKVVEDRNITNVHFLPRVSMSQVGAFLERADALLVHLKDDPLFRITIPAKTQAYMAAGKPILMAVAGDATQLIAQSHAGICASPGDASSIAEAVRQLAAMSPDELRTMGDSGRRFYWENMSLEVGAAKFLAIFQHVRNGNGSD